MNKYSDLDDKQFIDSIKKKENTSFMNDKTNDTSTIINYKKTPEPVISSQLNNFMRDSRGLKANITDKTLSHPRSTVSLLGATAKKIRPDSPSMTILKSKKCLDDSRVEQLKKQTNKSFDLNGIKV